MINVYKFSYKPQMSKSYKQEYYIGNTKESSCNLVDYIQVLMYKE